MNAPLVVVMKINAAMREVLGTLPSRVLSDESRQIMQVRARGIPAMPDEFDTLKVANEEPLEELIQLYWRVPARLRPRLVEQARGLVQLVLAMLDASSGRERPNRAKPRSRRRSS